MKRLYMQLIGLKGNGILFSKYLTDTGILVRGAALVLRKKQLLSVIHANDKGWHSKDGIVYNFRISGNTLFVRNLAIRLNTKRDANR